MAAAEMVVPETHVLAIASHVGALIRCYSAMDHR